MALDSGSSEFLYLREKYDIRLILEIEPCLQIFIDGSIPSPLLQIGEYYFSEISLSDRTLLEYSCEKWLHDLRIESCTMRVFITPLRWVDEDSVSVEEDMSHNLEEYKYTKEYHEETENYMDERGESIIEYREYRKRENISDEYRHEKRIYRQSYPENSYDPVWCATTEHCREYTEEKYRSLRTEEIRDESLFPGIVSTCIFRSWVRVSFPPMSSMEECPYPEVDEVRASEYLDIPESFLRETRDGHESDHRIGRMDDISHAHPESSPEISPSSVYESISEYQEKYRSRCEPGSDMDTEYCEDKKEWGSIIHPTKYWGYILWWWGRGDDSSQSLRSWYTSIFSHLHPRWRYSWVSGGRTRARSWVHFGSHYTQGWHG